jgi:hypothetical protein
MADDLLTLASVHAPRKKLKIDWPKYQAPVEPPPRRCDVCETERDAWEFSNNGCQNICGRCTHRGTLYLNGMEWRDANQIDQARGVLDAIKVEVKRDRKH